MDFRTRVFEIVRHIPKGKTMTYGEVAALAGNEKAARAVGAIMRTNYDPAIPCHRVVRADGRMGGYNRGGSDRKRAILKGEKAVVAAFALLALLVLPGCGKQVAAPAITPTTEPTPAVVESAPKPEAPTPETKPVSTPKPTPTPTPAPAPVTRKVSILAKQWEFVPSRIVVNEGDTVVLTITSDDVDHGFSLPGFKISETLEAGKAVTVTFVAGKKGTFPFSCNVFCGSGHSHMDGTVVVE